MTDVLRLAGSCAEDSLALMWDAVSTMRGRRSTEERRRVLTECRNLPWSEAERELHNLLRSNGIGGWVGNHRIKAEDTWILDVAFPQEQVALEYDSREFHTSASAFERDRLKVNQLQDIDWNVFLVTAQMLAQETAVLGWVTRALRKKRKN